MMDGVSVAAIHALSNSVSRKSLMREQLFLAHPPAPELGPASYSYDFVYLIFSGEARLCVSTDPAIDQKTAPPIEPGSPPFGIHLEEGFPPQSKVEKHMGTHGVVSVATLGPGECISDNLLTMPGSRWCLRPITPLELLVVPRKEWNDMLRLTAVSDLRALAQAKVHPAPWPPPPWFNRLPTSPTPLSCFYPAPAL